MKIVLESGRSVLHRTNERETEKSPAHNTESGNGKPRLSQHNNKERIPGKSFEGIALEEFLKKPLKTPNL